MDNYCWLYSEKVLHRDSLDGCDPQWSSDPQLSATIVYDSVTRYPKSEFVGLFCVNCTQKDCALNSQFSKKVVVTMIVPDEELDVCDEDECDCEENDVEENYDITDEDCCNCPSYAICFTKDLDEDDIEDEAVATDRDDGVLIASIPIVNEFVDFSDTVSARRVVGTVPLADGAELYCQALILDISNTFTLMELLFDNRGSSTWLQIDGSHIVKIPACKININGEILDVDANTVELINDTYHSSYLLDAKYDMEDAVRIAKGLFRRISEALNSD
jgi:hypothetical protein